LSSSLINAVSSATAEQIARDIFGVDGEAKRLAGEYDLNFLIRAAEKRALLKIAHIDARLEELGFQNAVLRHMQPSCDENVAEHLPVQQVLPALSGEDCVQLHIAGEQRYVRLLSYIEGRMLAHVSPHTPELLHSLGTTVAQVDVSLLGFSHRLAARDYKWNLAQADAMAAKLDNIEDPRRRAIASRHFERFVQAVKPRFGELPHSVIHGDANDHNIVVTGVGYDARVTGLIDFGDAMFCPTVCGLAIALAYTLLDKSDPLTTAAHVVRGYHAVRPLSEAELSVLYPLMLTRLAVSVTNSAFEKRLRPDDPYVVISEAPAWALLEALETVSPEFAHYCLRNACGLPPVPHSLRVQHWLETHAGDIGRVVEADLSGHDLGEHDLIGHDLSGHDIAVLDLSVGSLDLGLLDDLDTAEKFSAALDRHLHEAGARIGIGRYDETRLMYDAPAFECAGENGVERRTVHLGLDIFMPAGSKVLAPLPGRVHSLADNDTDLDYGACIVLEHHVDDGAPLTFYTLYGHLSRSSLEGLSPGHPIAQGQAFARLGNQSENGGWPPHLHLQIVTDLLGHSGTFPGVARPRDIAIWRSLSPNPNLLARIPSDRFPAAPMRTEDILQARSAQIGSNLSISYRRPLNVARGHRQYLYDRDGQRYLDCYNNVPHVGHSHPKVVRAAQRQMAVLNTNTRYLHENLVRYAQALTATLPAPLSVCFFTSSGSEATELALRLSRAHTGQRDLIVGDHAYHGHSTTLIDISPYKAEGPGGQGLPDWVHKATIPDDYRGPIKRGEASVGPRYAAMIDPLMARIHALGRGLCGFIIESIPSVAGQVVLPEGYLAEVYRKVRAAGGVCIADEVQTGFGRIGSHFWGFEHQGVVPDIVAIGKPIGNGHPLGAVVTTPEIAASFANGMEFFATFGGNPVSCAVGMAVLEVVASEGLQQHALTLGTVWMEGLRGLQSKHPIIGDVRGLGLFNGIELVLDPETREPAPKQAAYVVDRLRDFGILTGTDGPYHNVIKLRGPMVLTQADIDRFLQVLDRILGEDAARS
jgi:4-aminobutyrate aminotransferase-like enzyme/Ser/Thr protein kinase RdoA (MazF antagonist)